ncbi:MAG: hypothetical protein CMJ18_04305 [Phycisphaeraceae bacterium]|nr:hypothetical protein [Phycisphaeraceae bacterium]
MIRAPAQPMPSRAALACPGLFQFLKGERATGMVFVAIAAAAATALVLFLLAPDDPFGHNRVRIAIAAIVLFWSAAFSALDALQSPGRSSLYLILLPAVVLFSIFTYLPIAWAASLSFYDHSVRTLVEGGAPFVGLDNFTRMLADERFRLGLLNTLKFFAIGFLLGQLPAPTLAYLLHEVRNRKLQTFYKCVCFMPSLFSWPIIGVIWLWLLKPDGQLDVLARPILALGGASDIAWLGNPSTARFVFVCVGLWMGSGATALIWLASLAGIDPTLYEAAEIDGAGHWRRFTHVTFPHLVPTWIVLTILSFIGMFSIFDQVVVMRNPMIREAVYVVMLHIYEQGFRRGLMGYASAMSMALAAIVLLLTMINLKLSRKVEIV